MEAFRHFITQARSVVSAQVPLKICMGNVSVDMDSVVGSLILSYYYNLKFKEVYVPVVNCKRSFFPIKLDINMHLAQHKLPEMIFFGDDINQAGTIEKVQEVTLIDHNKLDVTQEALLNTRVRRIVDHHVDNNLYSEQLIEKQIELIGSAATLAIERILKEFPEVIDAELAHFLKAPILLDSYHFEPSLKDSKWTEKDLEIYKRLDQISEGAETSRVMFDRLFNAITDIDMNLSLGIENLLIKDFKTYFIINQGQSGVGVGTITVPLTLLLQKFTLPKMGEAIK